MICVLQRGRARQQRTRCAWTILVTSSFPWMRRASSRRTACCRPLLPCCPLKTAVPQKMNESAWGRFPLNSCIQISVVKKILRITSPQLSTDCIMNASHSTWMRHQAVFGRAKLARSQPARRGLTFARTYAQSTAVSIRASQGQPVHTWHQPGPWCAASNHTANQQPACCCLCCPSLLAPCSRLRRSWRLNTALSQDCAIRCAPFICRQKWLSRNSLASQPAAMSASAANAPAVQPPAASASCQTLLPCPCRCRSWATSPQLLAWCGQDPTSSISCSPWRSAHVILGCTLEGPL